MYLLALACDYDGTLAAEGAMSDATRAALGRLRESGRRVLMVTGRELPDLKLVCPGLDLFDWVVAENGALLYHPQNDQEIPLAPAPPEEFVHALRARNIRPLSVGRVIVATREPHEQEVLDAIRALGLELEIIFNKGAVMVLPPGVNKAFGLEAALAKLALSPRRVVAVGDGENDHALLALAGCSVAVANAVPSLKEAADFVTSRPAGDGVIELIDRLIKTDLAEIQPARSV
ncbi:MAG TPA: HAD family hydrolase [Alphaproteobacteria bacterium]|nr:HAD family hydrolase [Alphaproteobacteria bacterium]